MNTLGKRFFKAAGWQFFGNLLRVVLGLAASTLIVKWLGGEEFGKASWILSVTMYFSILGSAGLGTPFTRRLTQARIRKDYSAARNLVQQVLVFRLSVVLLAAAIFVIFRMLFPGYCGQIQDPSLLIFVPWLLLVTYLHGSMIRVLQVYFRQGLVVSLTAGEIIFKVAVVWVLGNNTPTAWDLLTAATISEFASFSIAMFATYHFLGKSKTSAQSSQPSGKKLNWKTLLREGRPSWLLAISERVLGRDVDILLIGIMVGPLEVVRYALPFTLATISISVATSAFQSTTNLATFTEARLGSESQNNKALLKVLFEYWSFFVVPIAVGGMLMGDRILHLLYGDVADGTALVSVLLFASFALSNLSGLAKDALQGIGNDKSPAKVHLIGGALNLTLSLVLIPFYGAVGAAAATLISTALIALVQVMGLPCSLKTFPSPRSLFAVFLALLCMFSVIHFSQNLNLGASESWGATMLLVIVGALAYILGLIFVNPRSSLGERFTNAPGVLRYARKVL